MAQKLRIENRYGVIPHEVLEHKGLSWKAKGVYGYLQSRPDGWDFSVDRIAEFSSDGRDSARMAVSELEALGYLTRRKVHGPRGNWDVEYALFASALPESERTKNPEYLEKQKEARKRKNSKKKAPADEPATTDNPPRSETATTTDNPSTDNPSIKKEGLKQDIWLLNSNQIAGTAEEAVEKAEEITEKKNRAVEGMLAAIRGALEACDPPRIYKPGKRERERAYNLATGKDFWAAADAVWQTREEFAANLVIVSSKLKYAPAALNAETVHANYARIYDAAIRAKRDAETNNSNNRDPRWVEA